MSKIIAKAMVSIAYKPGAETPAHIEQRLRKQLANLIAGGYLSGPKNGAMIESWGIEVTVAQVE